MQREMLLVRVLRVCQRRLRGQGGQAEAKNLLFPLIKKGEHLITEHDSGYMPLDTPAFHFLCLEIFPVCMLWMYITLGGIGKHIWLLYLF